jgi:uncharacterized protein (DUF362 family)
MSSTVAMSLDRGRQYPDRPPFHPSEAYPEYAHGDISPEVNEAYAAVRDVLAYLGLDRERFGTPEWNPLGDFIDPGSRVAIKPNLVISEHPLGDRGMEASVAHGSILRAVIDYALIALGGEGSIVIGDSPIKEVDFDRVTRTCGLRDVVDWYQSQKFEVELRDFRDLIAYRNDLGVILRTEPVQNAVGSVTVDLGTASALEGTPLDLVRSTAAVYDDFARQVHGPGRHLYAVSKAVIEADAVISVCKLKTHIKTGVTASIKNFVGSTNKKEWLPHFRRGTPKRGGDRFADEAPAKRRVQESVKEFVWSNRYLRGKTLHNVTKRAWTMGVGRALDRTVAENAAGYDYGNGDWFGNDTAWRMATDTCMAALFGRPDGTLAETQARPCLHIVDSIMAGDRNGPLKPEPKHVGLIAGALDPVALDTTCVYVMGYKPDTVPHIAGIHAAGRPLGTSDESEIEVVLNGEAREPASLLDLGIRFVPPDAWAARLNGSPTPEPAGRGEGVLYSEEG